MSDIDELRQAVEAGKSAFSHMSEQRDRCRKHLVGLIRITEENLREKRVELAQSKIRHEHTTREYEQLSIMLHSLIVTVEGSGPYSTLETPATLEKNHGPALALVSDDADAPKDTDGVETEDVRTGLKRLLKKQRTRTPQANQGMESPPAS